MSLLLYLPQLDPEMSSFSGTKMIKTLKELEQNSNILEKGCHTWWQKLEKVAGFQRCWLVYSVAGNGALPSPLALTSNVPVVVVRVANSLFIWFRFDLSALVCLNLLWVLLSYWFKLCLFQISSKYILFVK